MGLSHTWCRRLSWETYIHPSSYFSSAVCNSLWICWTSSSIVCTRDKWVAASYRVTYPSISAIRYDVNSVMRVFPLDSSYMLYAIHVICYMLYAIHVICCMLYVICYMLYTICYMLTPFLSPLTWFSIGTAGVSDWPRSQSSSNQSQGGRRRSQSHCRQPYLPHGSVSTLGRSLGSLHAVF